MRLNPQILRLQFRQHGVLSAAELAKAAHVSQPTISRALKQFGDSLLRFGSRRGARYALSSPIGDLGSNWPLFLIGPDGQPEQLGRLHALVSGDYWLEHSSPVWSSFGTEEFPDNVFPDVPWFLDDYRPQGFLGRAFARKHAAALGQDQSPSTWGGRVVIEAMIRFGQDFSGAFVLGREALASALATRPSTVHFDQRMTRYPELAADALRGDLVGSSAGGEQPKFVVEIAGPQARHAIVKFSTAITEPIGRRWADLLYAEHVAGTILAAHGFSVSRSDILDAGGQRFLEVERFDRTPDGGRRPVVSLRPMAAALLDGVGLPWPTSAASLHQNGWLTQTDADNLTTIWEFGRLIANTDMHDGNVSLIFTPERPVRLAPVYDMLPMAYRPGITGHIPDLQPSQLAIAENANPSLQKTMATEFWETLANADRVSDPFRRIASHHARVLSHQRM